MKAQVRRVAVTQNATPTSFRRGPRESPAHPGRPDGNGDDSFGRMLLDRILAGTPPGEHPLTFTADLPPRVSSYSEWPEWADPAVVRALRAAGIPQPWSHQAEAASIAAAVSTWWLRPDGVGQVAGVPASRPDRTRRRIPRHRSVSVTDQGARRRSTARHGGTLRVRAGSAVDPSLPVRRRHLHRTSAVGARELALDLHQPRHAAPRDPAIAQRWSHLLRNLRYVVVDECHSYRGVFGSNVALVLRRLRRIAAGTEPTRHSSWPAPPPPTPERPRRG